MRIHPPQPIHIMNSYIQPAFATPIYMARLNGDNRFDKIQSDFQSVFDDLVAKNKFSNKKFGGNTHLLSNVDFTENLIGDYNLQNFQSALDDCIKDYLYQLNFSEGFPRYAITSSWMALNTPGTFAQQHSHSYSDISGVYYFKTNGHDGSIYFENPVRTHVGGFITHRINTKVGTLPEVGKIIMFPGWLEHGVDFNTTEDDRISISFNIDFKRYDDEVLFTNRKSYERK